MVGLLPGDYTHVAMYIGGSLVVDRARLGDFEMVAEGRPVTGAL